MGLIYKSGLQEVEIMPIGSQGFVGQALVLISEKTLTNEHPLVNYPEPSIFTIKKRKRNAYILTNASAEVVTVKFENCFCLYDANKWSQAIIVDQITKETALKKEIQDLKWARTKAMVLEEIMTKQGVRVISDSQAQQLGIKVPEEPKE